MVSALRTVAKQNEQVEGLEGDLDQLDQSLLAKAFRGELVPQDPIDEPASALLERHRTSQAEAPANGKALRKSRK